MNETRYPLCWPDGWKRTPTRDRKRAQFGKSISRYDSALNKTVYSVKKQVSVWDGVTRIARELRLLGVDESRIIVSTNVPTRNDGSPRSGAGEPRDPGVAVYWKSRAGKNQCMPIDLYDRVADNLAAVAASLEALRAIERHGGLAILDRAFQGFAQLPASIITQRPWREVFGVDDGITIPASEIERRFRILAKKNHPDTGGSHEGMAELNAAREAALAEIG